MLTKEQKEKLRVAYYYDVWNEGERMTNYCTNTAAALAELPNGDFIPVEKQKIKTDFCFGESGYDFDDANEMANVARTSEDYFKRENMRKFEKQISDIDEQFEMHEDEARLPRIVMLIHKVPYSGQNIMSHLKGITFVYGGDVLEAMGGSAYVRELPGTDVFVRNMYCKIPTLEELKIIRKAYQEARDEHEKKVDRYLKRYSTSKVNSWTYWRDA